jgi:hypothetical protein
LTAEFGGVSNLAGAPSPPGNLTVWSHALAESAKAAGTITGPQYVAVRNALAGYEQAQNSLAKAILRGTGDNAPA